MSAPRDVAGLRSELDRMLRACVQCGLCLPHCATYLATGNEAQSPRGRLILLGELLAAPERPAGTATLLALDQCIGCHACVTACPSGVPFDLFEAAKQAGHHARRGMTARLMAHLLSRRATLAALRPPVVGIRHALRVLIGAGWRRRLATAPLPLRRLAQLVGSLPTPPRRDADLIRLIDTLLARAVPRAVAGGGARGGIPDGIPGGMPAASLSRASAQSPPTTATSRKPLDQTGTRQVALFRGCANAGLMPDATRRLRELLLAGGCEVIEVAEQGCCGALAAHVGQAGLADRQRAANRRAFAHLGAEGGVEQTVLVVEAAGCGLELKRAGTMDALPVRDAVEILAGLTLPPARSLPLRVVFHNACHARHGQGIVDEPRLLLQRIPDLVRLDPEETEVCCGSGGPYALLHAELAAQMGRRKAERLAATGADLVLTSNPGCLGQIAAALGEVAPDLPILPLTDLLWYAHVARGD